jgi:hypothetical protein
MNNLTKEFVSTEHRPYKLILGRINASALSGFIAGAVVASIIFLAGIALTTAFLK